MLRTEAEMIDRIANHEDMFRTATSDLWRFLPWEHAREHANDKTVKLIDMGMDQWDRRELTREAVLADMREYMEGALEHAEDHHDLESARSLCHFVNWLWLLGDEETLNFITDAGNYQAFGVPALSKICEVYEFEAPREESWFVGMLEKGHCGAPDTDECGCD